MSDENETSVPALAEAFGGSQLPTEFSPNALMQSSASIPRGSDKPYLTFKDGEWTYGAEHAECEEGSLWAINPHSFQFGLIEWLDSVAGGEVLVPAGTPYNASQISLKFDPEDPQHRIAPQIAVDMYCINGEDEGTQVQFKTSTRGGVDALNGLAQKIAKQANDPENGGKIVAIVALDSSSYMHKKYKRKTYVPLLPLQWFDDFELSVSDAELGTEDEAPEAPPEPPKRTRGGTSKRANKEAAKAPAKEPAKEPAAPAADTSAPPARRRRKA